MPEYLAPGVYVEEIEMGGKPIEGVSTSTAGFIGETERGPVEPRLRTGFEDFKRLYGSYIPSSHLPYSVEGFFVNGGKRAFIARVVGKNSKEASLTVQGGGGSPAPKPAKDDKKGKDEPKSSSSKGGAAFTVTAIGPGTWGNRISVKVDPASLTSLASVNPMYKNYFKLVIVYWKQDPSDGWKDKFPNTNVEPAVVEVYDNLSCDASSSDFYEKRINNISSLIEIESAGDICPGKTQTFDDLSGGSDGNRITLSDYDGDDNDAPGESTGLAAFKEVDEISIVCAPNENDVAGLTGAIISHCENMKDRFAILQAEQSAGLPGKLIPPKDSKYAAFYYPWINVIDPTEGRLKLIPPGGHVAGVYARSDIERGVHKAPANEVLRGIVSLQFPVSKGIQDLLNPRGVNCLRAFTGRGIRIWGARTVSSDPLWKYVNVRRLFLYLEESIEEGTQWVVFEPNDQRLWARVKQSVSDFLTRVWKDGALMGTTPQEAFFVKCDETTMTPDDIDNGRLIVLIGVAPVKPAEFVIFRIAQWRSGSAITE